MHRLTNMQVWSIMHLQYVLISSVFVSLFQNLTSYISTTKDCFQNLKNMSSPTRPTLPSIMVHHAKFQILATPLNHIVSSSEV